MIINGKEIAKEIKESLKKETTQREIPPTLFIITVGNDPVTQKFLEIKKKFGADIGISVNEKKFEESITTDELVKEIISLNSEKNSGIIIQLPLPEIIDTQAVLDSVETAHDVDVLSSESLSMFKNDSLKILPPVMGAMKEILLRNHVFTGNKNVVIIGRGRLVGIPSEIWFKKHGSSVTLLGRDTTDLKSYTQDADIIVLGAGSQGLLKPDMIKTGVVILDAGTSVSPVPGRPREVNSKLLGDADPACADKASVFTPVPGGIGPITIAMLFKNLLTLTNNLSTEISQ